MQHLRIVWAYVGLTSLTAFIVYCCTFTADFAYDDSRAVVTNNDLRPSVPWVQLFWNDFWGTPLKHSGSHKSYRPLCVLTFRLNYHLGGLNPIGYHMFNVLLHSAVTMLFTIFCSKLIQNAEIGLLAGVLFAVHPIHTEAVAGVVGRADCGAGLFFLACLNMYLNVCSDEKDRFGKTNWKCFTLCVVFGTLSMLTKENGITVLLVCAVYDILVISQFKLGRLKESVEMVLRKGTVIRVVLLGMLGFCLLYLRLVIMGNATPDFAPSDNPAASEGDLLTRLLTFLYLPVFNFGLLLYPSQLSFDWSMDSVPLLRSIFDARNGISLSFYALYISTFLVCQSLISDRLEHCNGDINHKLSLHSTTKNGKMSLDGAKYATVMSTGGNVISTSGNSEECGDWYRMMSCLVLFSIAWMTLSFLPATNLFFYVGFVVAERILYIPSMAYCLLLALGVAAICRMSKTQPAKRAIGLLCIIVVILFMTRTVQRCFDWQNEETLYRSGIEINPPKAWGNLGNILAKQGKTKDAEEAYRAALRFRPNMADTHYNLGILLQERKRYEEAVSSYQNAIHYRPKLAAAHLNLGILYEEIGDHERALMVLKRAENISDYGLKDPQAHLQSLTSIRYNIGKILFEMNRHQAALSSFQSALSVMPVDYEKHSLFNMLGQTLSLLKRHEEAGGWYRKALQEKEDHIPAHLTYAKHLHTMGQSVEADKWFTRAYKERPGNKETCIHYAQFLVAIGRQRDALDLVRKAVRDNPNDAGLVYFAAGIFREQNEIEQSEVYYRRAVELQPNELSYLMNYGAVLHLRGKLDEAEKIYLQILRDQPNEKLTLTNLKKLRTSKNRKPG